MAQRPQVVFSPTADVILTQNPAGNSDGSQPSGPASNFEQKKGRLPLPVDGKVIVRFGAKTSYGAPSNGILISIQSSAAVVSPADGQVVNAGRFRSYGNLLTINAGDGYQILIAGAGKLIAKVGENTKAGERVGSMRAESPKGGNQNAQQAVIYVEFRKDGRPIDPGPWWKK